MTQPVLLGIDGGGSHTTAWLADEAGRVLGKGESGPSNAKAVGGSRALESLQTAIRSAFTHAKAEPGPLEVACLGLAGFDRPQDKKLLEAWSTNGAWARRLVLVNDCELVIAAGTPHGWGVGLIAGTGSIAVGRWPDGSTARAGGWGYLFGDEGSAYAVAIAGLKWLAHRADGRVADEADDILTDRICKALDISGPRELVSRVYDPSFSRAEIAALAPVIVAAAEDDPFINEAILVPAAYDLAELVMTVVHSLGWHEWDDHRTLPLALAGGFLLSTPIVSRSLLEALEEMGLSVEPNRVEEPVRGALALAKAALHC